MPSDDDLVAVGFGIGRLVRVEVSLLGLIAAECDTAVESSNHVRMAAHGQAAMPSAVGLLVGLVGEELRNMEIPSIS
jgi:hypothetical protein